MRGHNVVQMGTEALGNNTHGILNNTGVESSIIKYLAVIYAEILRHRGSPMCYSVKMGITDISDISVKKWNDIVNHVNKIEVTLEEWDLPSLKDKFIM